jgi:2-phosphoglycerate kinase
VLLLLTGASGVGKSTCRVAIQAALGDELDCIELRDVVAIPAAPDVAWRQRGVEAVVQRALAGGRDVLLAGDPVAPGELIAAQSADRLDRIAVCLLDCDATSQTERLRRRGDPEELLPRHVAFADWMREHVRDPGHMPE